MIMSEVVDEHPSLIPVINRFGIRLGLGDKQIKTICEEHDLDSDFLLIVINTFLNDEYFPKEKLQAFHVSLIVDYLRKTNLYYLHSQLPNIERHLALFISKSRGGNQSLELIGRFFSEFKGLLTRRIEEDERELFPNSILMCDKIAKEHKELIYGPVERESFDSEDPIEALLADLKSIMVKHLSGDYDDNLCYAVFFSICSLERDMKQHNRIRYRILKPMIMAMENICHCSVCMERYENSDHNK